MRHPNSFTTRHPSTILLWKDWSGSLSIEYFTKLWILQTSSYFGRRHQPKNHPDLYTSIDYISQAFVVYLSNHFSPQNTDESSPPPPWDIPTHRPHFGARGQSCLPNLRGKQVSFLHDQYRRFTSHKIRGTGIYLPTLWLIFFYGFHASKNTIHRSYVIMWFLYLQFTSIYLHQFRHPSVFEPMANVPLSLWVWVDISLKGTAGGSTSSLAPSSSHFWWWLGKKSMTTTALK